jgi:hypothetical protein
MSEQRGRCSRCVYWKPRAGVEKEGSCCKHAPMPVVQAPRSTLFVTWPITMADDWCGEFRPAESKGEGP